MATTKTTEELFSGNGSQTSFPFTIEYLRTSDIAVRVSGVLQTETTHYSVVGTNIVFVTAPATGSNNIKITRITDIDAARSIYAAGSSIRAKDLNTNHDQILFKLQEKDTRTPSATVSATAPTDAVSGDTWYDTVSGRSFVYYTDVDTSQWVEANPPFDAAEAVQAATQINFLPSGTGAVTRTVDSKLKEFVSVKDFGVTGDGTTNDTVNIQKAFDATPDNGVLVFPTGTYVITNTITVNNKNITVQAYGAKFLIKADVDAFTFNNYSDAVVRELSSNYDKSDTNNLHIDVNALSTAPAKGTIIKIVSNAIDLYHNDSGTDTTQYRTGEWFITGPSSTTTQIKLKSPLRYTVGVSTTDVNPGDEPKIDSYTTAMVARVIIPVERKIVWSGGEIAYEDGHDGDSWNANCFNVTGYIGSLITDLTISRCYAHGVSFNGCVDSIITNSIFRDHTNNTSQSQFGYGIDDTGSLRTQISNCNFSACRHGQTTTGRKVAVVASGSVTSNQISNFIQQGVTDGGLVSDCTGQGDIESVFDTHQDAHNYTFTNCVVNGGEIGFSARGQNINFVGCVANNCARGFKFFTRDDTSHTNPDGFSAGKPEGFTTGSLKSCISKGYEFDGTPISAQDCREILIEDCQFEHSNNRTLLIDSSLVKIGGNNVFKVSNLDNSTEIVTVDNGGIFDLNEVDVGTPAAPGIVTNVNSSNTTGRVPTSAVNTTANTITPTGGNTLQNGVRVFYNAMVHGIRYNTTEGFSGESYQGPNAIIGGLENNKAYYVVNRTATTFQLAHTRGGSAISFTSTGNNFQVFTYINPELRILNGAVVEIDATEVTSSNSGTIDYRLLEAGPGRFFTVNGTIIAKLSKAYDQLLTKTANITGNSNGCIYWSIDGTANDITSEDGNFFESNLLGKFCKAESLDGLVRHDYVTPDLKSVFKRNNQSYTLTTNISDGLVFFPRLEPYNFLKSTISGRDHRIRYTLNWKKTGTADICDFELKARSVDLVPDSAPLQIPAASLAARMIVDCYIYNNSGTDTQDWTITFLPDNGAVDIRMVTTTVDVTESTSTQFLKIAARCPTSTGDSITLVDSEILCDLQSQNADN